MKKSIEEKLKDLHYDRIQLKVNKKILEYSKEGALQTKRSQQIKYLKGAAGIWGLFSVLGVGSVDFLSQVTHNDKYRLEQNLIIESFLTAEVFLGYLLLIQQDQKYMVSKQRVKTVKKELDQVQVKISEINRCIDDEEKHLILRRTCLYHPHK